MNLQPILVESLSQATAQVFSTMLGVEVVRGEVTAEDGKQEANDGVVSFIGLAGEWAGSSEEHTADIRRGAALRFFRPCWASKSCAARLRPRMASRKPTTASCRSSAWPANGRGVRKSTPLISAGERP